MLALHHEPERGGHLREHGPFLMLLHLRQEACGGAVLPCKGATTTTNLCNPCKDITHLVQVWVPNNFVVLCAGDAFWYSLSQQYGSGLFLLPAYLDPWLQDDVEARKL